MLITSIRASFKLIIKNMNVITRDKLTLMFRWTTFLYCIWRQVKQQVLGDVRDGGRKGLGPGRLRQTAGAPP